MGVEEVGYTGKRGGTDEELFILLLKRLHAVVLDEYLSVISPER